MKSIDKNVDTKKEVIDGFDALFEGRVAIQIEELVS